MEPTPTNGDADRPAGAVADRDGPRADRARDRRKRPDHYHGLPADRVIRPAEFADETVDRMDLYRGRLLPDHPLEEWHYASLCVILTRIDQVLQRWIVARGEQAARAAESWAEDRAVEARELGGRLAGRPERILPQLLKTRHGADWLIGRWQSLDRLVERAGALTDAIAARALDLLGVPKDERLGALADRLGVEPERAECDKAGSERFAGPAARDAWKRLVEAETAELQRRIDSFLAAQDDRARHQAEAGVGPDGPEVRAAFRLETQLRKWKSLCERELRRLQRRDRQHELFGDGPTRRASSAADEPVRSFRDDPCGPAHARSGLDPDFDPDFDDEDEGDDPTGASAIPPTVASPTPSPSSSPSTTPADEAPATAGTPADSTAPAPTGPSSSTAGGTGTTATLSTPQEVWAGLTGETQAMIRRLDAQWAAFKGPTGSP